MKKKGSVSRAVAAQLLGCELALLSPVVRRNRRQVEALLAKDFVEFGTSGRAWSRDAILELLQTEVYEPPIIENFDCHELAPGVVLVTYRTIRGASEHDTRKMTLRSSIWSKHARSWVLRFHQGTRMP